MENKLSQIKQTYDFFQRSMLLKGKMPYRDTGIGFWSGSNVLDVFEVFKKIGLDNYQNFLDLGSGDGRVVLTAALFGLHATGVEVDKELHNRALQVKEHLQIHNVSFFNNDFRDHNMLHYDCLFCDPDQPISRFLERKLLKEMNGILIVQGYHFHPGYLKKINQLHINGNLYTVYGKE